MPAGRSATAERGAQRERLELGAEAGAVRLREPLVGPADGIAVDARERLVAADAAGGELEHRLEDGADRVRCRGAAAPRPRCARRRATAAPRGWARSGGSGGGRRAWRRTARRRRARAARRPRARPPGTWRRRPRTRRGRGRRAPRRARYARVRRPRRRPRPPTPGSTSTNSSPPSRPTASPSRTTARSLVAAAASTLSPSAWPSESLIRLKWSRSTTTTLSGRPDTPASSTSRRRRSCAPRWFSSPVRPSVAAWWRRCSRWRAES